MPPTKVAIGVDVGGTGTKAALVTEAGTLSHRTEVPTDPDRGTSGILQIVGSMMRTAASEGFVAVAVGVGAAGFIDIARGEVTFSPNLTYEEPKIHDAVSRLSGLPVAVDNDANAAAWGERTFGIGNGTDDMVLVTLGTGIGGGIIQNGSLIRGHTGAGAEIGHTVVVADGPLCKCGLRGCFEQLASGQAIERMATEVVASGKSSKIRGSGDEGLITGPDVTAAAAEGDEVALEVLAAAGRFLGIGLSNIANLFDPEIIVLGGGLVDAGEPYLSPARTTFADMTSAQHRRTLRVETGSLGNDAGIAGAAALAFDEVPST